VKEKKKKNFQDFTDNRWKKRQEKKLKAAKLRKNNANPRIEEQI
jgi:hypothetical protein